MNCTAIPGFAAKTTAKIAAPLPTQFIGPRKKPSGTKSAKTIAKTNADVGTKLPMIAVKYGDAYVAALLNIANASKKPIEGGIVN